MSEGVWAHFFGDTSELRIVLNNSLYRSGCEPEAFAFGIACLEAAIANEQGDGRISSRVHVCREPFARFRADKHGAVLLAFSAHHEFTSFEVDMITVEVGELRYAQA